MNKVYIVTGSVGQYADYQEWVVCTYADQEAAEQHCKLAQEAIDKAIKERKYSDSHDDIVTPYDKRRINSYYIRVKYEVIESSFARHVDEYQDLIQE